MKILINCSNLTIGGGMQVAHSFIIECAAFVSHEFHITLSAELTEYLKGKTFKDHMHFYHIDGSIISLRERLKVLKQLNKIEAEVKPDVVYSVFGPTYWRPKAKHIMGFAMPQYLYHDLPTSRGLYKNGIKQLIQKLFIRFGADHYVLETSDAADRLSRVFHIPRRNISVVSNTYSTHFRNLKEVAGTRTATDNETRLLTVSAFYPHKNLGIIRDVVPFLKGQRHKVRFCVTIPEHYFAAHFGGLEDYVTNLGPVNPEACPDLYKSSDFMFLPTLLECFSANYPEAMIMGKPILTSDLPFARDICRDAAVYFDPKDPEAIANAILDLIDDKARQEELREAGFKRVQAFNSAEERAAAYIDICKSFLINS